MALMNCEEAIFIKSSYFAAFKTGTIGRLPVEYMANDQPFKRGNIATYEDASAEDLRRRKEDLRVGIRNPQLSAGEFVREVATHAFVTAVAVGYSAWGAIRKLIETGMDLKNPWFRQNLTIDSVDAKGQKTGKIHFMANKEIYEQRLIKNGQNLAKLLFPGSDKTAAQVAEEIIKDCRELGHSYMVDELEKLLKETLVTGRYVTETGEVKILTEAERVDVLLKFLTDVLSKSDEAHLAQYGRMVTRYLEKKMQGTQSFSPISLASDIWHEMRPIIIESGLADNIQIINKYRVPSTAVLVAGATLFTAYQANKAAKRQKALDQTAELTHIERLEKERAEAKQNENAPQIAAS